MPYTEKYIKEKLSKELGATHVTKKRALWLRLYESLKSLRSPKGIHSMARAIVSKVAVTDESDGCGAKFSAVIVSPKFEGKPLLQRHRMVNSILEEELKVIHAFSQQTLTPQQWEEKKS